MSETPLQLTPAQRAHLHTWAAALRSGQYPQARATLKQSTASGDAYCCLGVERLLAGCLVHYTSWVPEGAYLPYAENDIRLGDYGLNQLPEQFLPWPDAPDSHEAAPVPWFTVLNDEYGFSFAQLADVVQYLADNAQEVSNV